MNYSLLRDLINQLESYQQDHTATDMAGFSLWLYQQYHGQEAPLPENPYQGSYDDQLAIATGTLHKHLRHYMKTVLKQHDMSSEHDFSYLATLQNFGDLRKSELIELNMQEFSSGMEVIRRLLRLQLIEDFNDPDDGRSKRVRITEQGRTIFQALLTDMRKASTILGAPLSPTEKIQLLSLINKLLRFHQPIWYENHNEPLEDILQKLNLNSK